MYCDPNFKTAQELKKAVKAGESVSVFSPGPYPCPENGTVSLEGPHYPQPHKWYARVEVKNGQVIRVIK